MTDINIEVNISLPQVICTALCVDPRSTRFRVRRADKKGQELTLDGLWAPQLASDADPASNGFDRELAMDTEGYEHEQGSEPEEAREEEAGKDDEGKAGRKAVEATRAIVGKTTRVGTAGPRHENRVRVIGLGASGGELRPLLVGYALGFCGSQQVRVRGGVLALDDQWMGEHRGEDDRDAGIE